MIESMPGGQGPGPCGGLQRAMALLAEAAEALSCVSPDELAAAGASEALVAWDRCQNRIDAARASVTAAWDARLEWAVDGARSAPAWLAAHTELSRPAAAGQVRLGRALRSMPATAAAFAAGELGVAKVRLLGDAACEAPEVFSRDEELLVREARKLRVDQVQRALEFWRARANPDGTAERAARQHDRRRVDLSRTFEGTWRLDGQLPPEAGEVLHAELTRRARAAYRAEKAEADASGGAVSSTAGQRRADALVDLARQSAAAGDGGAANVPAITAVVDVTKLAAADTAPADVVGETEHGTPITAQAARRLACDCGVARVLTDAASTPVDLGVAARLPSPAQRRALSARDRGCVFPGCDSPPGWTSAHHLVHWIDEGPTDLQNLVLLCSHHHHRVHEGGFGVTRLDDGGLRFTRPDGSHLTVPRGTAPPPEHPWPHVA